MRRYGRQTDMASALKALSRGFDKKSEGRYLQLRAAAAWEQVAGPQVAEHTTGAHIRGGELVIYVDNSVWATELSALAGPYREAINQELGQKAVRSVRFAVSRKVETRRSADQAETVLDEFYQPDPIDPIPLNAVERAQVESSAAGIRDDHLREAVIRATVAGMEWRKGQKAAKQRQTPRDGL